MKIWLWLCWHVARQVRRPRAFFKPARCRSSSCSPRFSSWLSSRNSSLRRLPAPLRSSWPPRRAAVPRLSRRALQRQVPLKRLPQPLLVEGPPLLAVLPGPVVRRARQALATKAGPKEDPLAMEVAARLPRTTAQ